MPAERMRAIPIRDAKIFIDGADVTRWFVAPTVAFVPNDRVIESTTQAEIDTVVRRMLGTATIDPNGGNP